MDSAQFLGVVRAVLAALGGYLVGQGFLDDSTVQQLSGAVATIAAAAWSVYSKRKS